MPVTFAPPDAAQRAALQPFILEHGSNDWNWLPPDDIAAHVQDIAAGSAFATVAVQGAQMLGVVTYRSTLAFSHYQDAERTHKPHGYICEAVVRRDQVGRGLGTQLLLEAVEGLRRLDLQEIYVDRHEENAASASMMRKAGFVEVDTFAEPQRRPHGSGRTTVCRLLLA